MSESSTPQVHTLQSTSIIIFHPGSRNLRFGRASVGNPETILHAIGRRRIKHDDPLLIHKDTLIPLGGRKAGWKSPPEVESARLQLCHTLQTSPKTDGGPRYVTPTQQIAAFNKRSKPEVIQGHNLKQWETFEGVNKVIGDEVLKIDPDGEFNIHFPWRRGQLNIHKGVGGSMSSVFTDLEDIWSYCITERLDIPIKDLKHYRAVVIIPTIFDRLHAKEMMNLIINRLGFGGGFLIQDHVCATFGAGLACATVVDVGDQKISVSCVEDGISYPLSRIELKYGGGDLTLAFWSLLNQSAVPFKIDLDVLWDVDFLTQMKEKFCHFDLNRCGPEEQTILWEKPNCPFLNYNVLLADELLIVPLSYFNPDLLKGSIGTKAVVLHKQQATISDDPFDSIFISETSRRGLKETEGEGEEEFIDESKDNENTTLEKIPKITDAMSDSLLGLEQAILQSIDSSNLGEDLKRRLYSCIIIVGGGFKFKGLGHWLQNKVLMGTPRLFKTEPQEVITQPKDGDPSLTTWKGASILSTLETAHELWIKSFEWNTLGSRILRERSLCHF